MYLVQGYVAWRDEWVTLGRFAQKSNAEADKVNRERHAFVPMEYRVVREET